MAGVYRVDAQPPSREIQQVFAALRAKFDDLEIERLGKYWDGDDDNLWYIRRKCCKDIVQLETNPDGVPPFLVESDWDSREVADAEEAIALITQWLDR